MSSKKNNPRKNVESRPSKGRKTGSHVATKTEKRTSSDGGTSSTGARNTRGTKKK